MCIAVVHRNDLAGAGGQHRNGFRSDAAGKIPTYRRRQIAAVQAQCHRSIKSGDGVAVGIHRGYGEWKSRSCHLC